MAEQMTFDLPVKTAQGRDDFFVSPSNALAVEMLENWPKWPSRKLVLIGPKAAGKTHLAHVWATDIEAKIIAAKHLADTDFANLAQTPVVVENIPEISADMPCQKALFHLHNMMQANGSPLLLTADSPPARWQLSLPDLQSRMSATSITTLSAPDDALLSAVLVKLFADRQISVQPKLISYLLKRMDRSLAATAALVLRLDQAALSKGSAITQKLAAQVLDNPPKNAA